MKEITKNEVLKMTKSEIFKKAHKLAKAFVGSYKACFALALREVLKTVKAAKLGIENLKEWSSYGKSRVYFSCMVETSKKGKVYANCYINLENQLFGNDLMTAKCGLVSIPESIKNFMKENF
jgi:hypothetical protein